MYDVSKSTPIGWWFAKTSKHEGEDEHAKDLGRDADVVDEREQANTQDVDERRRREGQEADEGLLVEERDRGWVGEDDLLREDRRQDERNRRCDRRHGDHAGPEVDPAGEPAERPVRQSLGPLVDRPGHREVAGELSEVQGDERLTEDDQRPGPEDRWPTDAECDRLNS